MKLIGVLTSRGKWVEAQVIDAGTGRLVRALIGTREEAQGFLREQLGQRGRA